MTIFSDLFDTVCDNPFKTLGVIIVGVGTGGLAFVAAPSIAAGLGAMGVLGATSTGTAISSLAGVALSNASLAALGGGAVAAGGGGMATGALVVGGVGAASGLAASATVAVVAKEK